MPKRTDIETIMVIGAGPIVIGQACEFDYSGTQAIKALREEGYRIVLVNSNPATIMTDPELADATYVEPIRRETLERVIAAERPDALLPTMGGQTSLNASLELAEAGVLEQYGVQLIGADREAIAKAEDRKLFQQAMQAIGLDTPVSRLVNDFNSAQEALDVVGLPAIIRPSFTLGGTGGGIAYNREEYQRIVSNGLRASPVGTVLIEESVLGWKEYEMEVIRDRADNCIIVCSIENIDPMGIHTGDSVTVAPALTLTDKEYQIMRNASIAVLREIGVETGGSNVQFAVDPASGRQVVIEMNPRVSRSSALASKATGFPIAKVAAKLAIGYTLDELDNDITRITPASFEPTIDYIVTKIPRFTFEKFPGADPLLTTSMKSVGEAMAVGRNFQESLQKALRSMETGLTGLDEIDIPGWPERDAVRAALARPTPDRLRVAAQAFRIGMSLDDVYSACRIDRWFLAQVRDLVRAEDKLRSDGLPKTPDALHDLKRMGFSDQRLATLTGLSVSDVAAARKGEALQPVYKRIDTCAAEFPSQTSYMYSAFDGDGLLPAENEADISDRDKIIILGGGPNRIGQGIEFDYCCVHAVYALRAAGYEAIMVNCNPETVSTDYDTSDRLYFEPLTAEDVLAIVRTEQARGNVVGVIVQFGGQTPLKLAHGLEAAGVPILGTTVDAIDLAEDRERFQGLLQDLNLRQPANGTATTADGAARIAESIGYPVVIRPSYVLGGRAMEIVYDEASLRRYMEAAVIVSGDDPVLIDKYVREAVEVDVDVVADADGQVYVAGIMQHIEEAGIHSGDSACSLPPYSLPDDVVNDIADQAIALAKALGVVGLMNTQFAVQGSTVYILEVNPRASRTVPFVAKATGIPIAKIAARVMAGAKLAEFGLDGAPRNGGLSNGGLSNGKHHIAVKESVFPFNRFPGVDTLLGPEMKSTGEVMGMADTFGRAFAKAQIAAGHFLPRDGAVFFSVKDDDKPAMVDLAKALADKGFVLKASRGTGAYLARHGLRVEIVNKVLEGQPHVVDALINGDIQMVINTTEAFGQSLADSFHVRRAALGHDLPYYTTVAGARAAVQAVLALAEGALEVAPLQSYFEGSAITI